LLLPGEVEKQLDSDVHSAHFLAVASPFPVAPALVLSRHDDALPQVALQIGQLHEALRHRRPGQFKRGVGLNDARHLLPLLEEPEGGKQRGLCLCLVGEEVDPGVERERKVRGGKDAV
jgi:hypothetical protein